MNTGGLDSLLQLGYITMADRVKANGAIAIDAG
jgi:hypothetical protein